MTPIISAQTYDEFKSVREAASVKLFPENLPDYKRFRDAFNNVHRENYLNNDFRTSAYRDMPFPGEGGVIQPSLTMIASYIRESLPGQDSKVLLIGRNSAYLGEILKELTENIYVIDSSMGLEMNGPFNLKSTMSYFGWVEESPFDTIILFGSVSEIPQALVTQLKINGKLIFPLEGSNGSQTLVKAVRFASGFSLNAIGESYIHKLMVPN